MVIIGWEYSGIPGLVRDGYVVVFDAAFGISSGDESRCGSSGEYAEFESATG